MTEAERPTLSRDALDALRAELEDLKTNGREKMSARLLEARELGDVSDNAAFETAKHDQALLEGRIMRLEAIVKDAIVREGPVDSKVVVPGVIVTVRDIGDASIEDSFVVAESEERITGVRVLSPRSPLGQALLGKTIGDRATYEAPGGTFTYEIVNLRST